MTEPRASIRTFRTTRFAASVAASAAIGGALLAGCGADMSSTYVSATRPPAAERRSPLEADEPRRSGAPDAGPGVPSGPMVPVDATAATALSAVFDAPGVGPAAPPSLVEAPAAPHTAAASRPAGAPDYAHRYRVQLGAYARGSTAASIAWEGVRSRHATLAARTPLIGAALASDGTPIHRLQVAGLTRAEARTLCAVLAAAGDGCFVVPPPHPRPR